MMDVSNSQQNLPSGTTTTSNHNEVNRRSDDHLRLSDKDTPTTTAMAQAPPSQQQQHSHHHNSDETSFYAPPHQRQRWGDTQVAPHTNWGDLFFDVFYVAAAYNLGNLLKDTPSKEGLLYTAGIFFPIMNIWSYKAYYDGRFYYVNDYYHRIYEIFFLVSIATMILHIRSYEVLSHPKQHPDMFIFCLSASIAFTIAFGRYVEIIICVKFFPRHASGLHIEAYATAIFDAIGYAMSMAWLIAATIYSGTQHFSDKYIASDNTSEYFNETKYATISQADDHNSSRFLAASEYTAEAQDVSDSPDDMPIWLLFGATFSAIAYFIAKILRINYMKEKKESKTVPTNVEFMIRRYGEWVMLMLGEGILSLLLVDIVQIGDYYVTFVSGLISIVLLQYLHYQSQPSDPNLHAFRRSMMSSFLFFWLMQVYSLALIVFGACYKMLLYEFVYQSNDDNGYDSARMRGLLFVGLNDRPRFLAGASDSSAVLSQLSTDERQQRAAHFFSGSLSLIFFCLDALSLAHRGIIVQWKRCNDIEGTKLQHFLRWFLVTSRLLTIVFVASLSQFVSDPAKIATIGLAVVITQLCIRFTGYYTFHSASDAEERTLERIIQYNTARILDHPH